MISLALLPFSNSCDSCLDASNVIVILMRATHTAGTCSKIGRNHIWATVTCCGSLVRAMTVPDRQQAGFRSFPRNILLATCSEDLASKRRLSVVQVAVDVKKVLTLADIDVPPHVDAIATAVIMRY